MMFYDHVREVDKYFILSFRYTETYFTNFCIFLFFIIFTQISYYISLKK